MKPTMCDTQSAENRIRETLNKIEQMDDGYVRLEFIGEAWVNDYAREVDDGRVTFTVPIEHMRANGGEWAIHPTSTSYRVSDMLHRHENAPAWVQEWRGPFTIKLANFSP